VYDNVDDPGIDLLPLIPQGDGCAIIITSRNYLLGNLCPGSHLELDNMTIQEALLLLLYPETQLEQVPTAMKEEAAVVAQELGYLPIALQQAWSYMRQTNCSFGVYLRSLLESREKLLARPRPYPYNHQNISAYASFNAAFAAIGVRDQRLLQLLSCLYCKDFPLDLLNEAANYDFSDYETKYIDHGDEFYSGQAMLKDVFLSMENGT